MVPINQFNPKSNVHVFTLLLISGLWLAIGVGQTFGQSSGGSPSPYAKPEPVRPNLPGAVSEELGGLTMAPLVREGTFVSAARGQLLRGKSGRWFFIFDPDATGRVLPSMVVLPNLNLAAMERMVDRVAAAGGNADGVRMLVTGQAFVYRDLNYLLVAAPPMAVRTEAPTANPAASATPNPNAAPPTPAPAAPPTGEPSIQDIVGRLDRVASTVPATSPMRAPSGANLTVTPADAAETGASREATGQGLPVGAISSRRGRITRASDGALTFSFDTDNADPAAKPTDAGNTALVLMPSQTLEMIEALSDRAGEAATYTVSGEVFNYRGRNFLLVRSYRVNRPTDQVLPTQ